MKRLFLSLLLSIGFLVSAFPLTNNAEKNMVDSPECWEFADASYEYHIARGVNLPATFEQDYGLWMSFYEDCESWDSNDNFQFP